MELFPIRPLFGRVDKVIAVLVMLCLVGQASSAASRIVGGTSAALGLYPYQVELASKYNGAYSGFCGGSLIAPDVVLTAGHCMDDSWRNWYVIAGTVSMSIESINLKSVQYRRVIDAKTHAQFSLSTMYNDIAILRLDSPFTISSTIRSTPLAGDTSFSAVGKTATVTGFGAIYWQGPQSNSLRQVNVKVVTMPFSKNPAGFGGWIAAGGVKGYDSCQGDSGGPLVMPATEVGKLQYVQIGITSFGDGCATTSPGVYTRISMYVSWLKANAWSAPISFALQGVTLVPGSNCGNNKMETGEQCDGSDLPSCLAVGYTTGTTSCSSSCVLVVSGCAKCGNNKAESGETCDGTDLKGSTCISLGLGFNGGTLSCANCAFVTNSCTVPTPPVCGNNIIESGEVCDGSALGLSTCKSLKFNGGVLACSTACAYDTSGCYVCGNGVVEPGEECDGLDINNSNCTDFGFTGGDITCTSTCKLSNITCIGCGNGIIEMGEDCDGNDFGGNTCQSQGFTSGLLTCTPACQLSTETCTRCGNGVIEVGEKCDGFVQSNVTCLSLGFTGGNIACSPDCTFSTSDCSTAPLYAVLSLVKVSSTYSTSATPSSGIIDSSDTTYWRPSDFDYNPAFYVDLKSRTVVTSIMFKFSKINAGPLQVWALDSFSKMQQLRNGRITAAAGPTALNLTIPSSPLTTRVYVYVPTKTQVNAVYIGGAASTVTKSPGLARLAYDSSVSAPGTFTFGESPKPQVNRVDSEYTCRNDSQTITLDNLEVSPHSTVLLQGYPQALVVQTTNSSLEDKAIAIFSYPVMEACTVQLNVTTWASVLSVWSTVGSELYLVDSIEVESGVSSHLLFEFRGVFSDGLHITFFDTIGRPSVIDSLTVSGRNVDPIPAPMKEILPNTTTAAEGIVALVAQAAIATSVDEEDNTSNGRVIAIALSSVVGLSITGGVATILWKKLRKPAVDFADEKVSDAEEDFDTYTRGGDSQSARSFTSAQQDEEHTP